MFGKVLGLVGREAGKRQNKGKEVEGIKTLWFICLRHLRYQLFELFPILALGFVALAQKVKISVLLITAY